MDEKYLDKAVGLPALWAKIKALVNSSVNTAIAEAITTALNKEV